MFCELSLFINDTAEVNMILFDENKVHMANDPSDHDINTLFMLNDFVIFKDRKGITCQVNYLVPHIFYKILKHEICTEDDTNLFVYAILLSLINTPDIGTIPVTVEQYVTKLPKSTHQQIEQISNLEILGDDHCKFMRLHCKMNHLPFPAMIYLAEHNRINKKFT
jgi:hypothetical protein